MPGPADLMALLQGGGGGAPPGAPPGGAPMPPSGGGGGAMVQALQSKLAELMQDPVAMKGIQAYMQQMGGGMGAPGAAQAPPTPGPQDVPPGSMPPGLEAPPGAPPDDAEAMASDAIDKAGGWEGQQTPTQTDIERLTSDPSQENISSFDEQFGEGAAEKYLEEEKGEGPDEQAKEQAAGGEEKESDPY
jgi:hypothetical protein